MIYILKIFQALSLDVLVAGVSCVLLALKISGQDVELVQIIIFACSLWIIYSLDHLLDAAGSKGCKRAWRHQYHYDNFGFLSICVSMLTGITVWLVLHYLPVRILMWGIILALFCFLHLVLVQVSHRISYPKEFGVAVLFMCGVWLLPVLDKNSMPDFTQMLVWTTMFLSAWSNLLMLSIFERSSDRLSGFSSQVIISGYRLNRKLVLFNGLLIFLLSIVFVIVTNVSPNNLLIASSLILTGLWPVISLFFYRRMSTAGLYRLTGDLVFWVYLLPVLTG